MDDSQILSESTGFGKILKDARKANDWRVFDVAQVLNLSKEKIQALEQEDFSRLPEKTFIKGYITSYAKLLDIDPAPLIESLPVEDTGISSRISLSSGKAIKIKKRSKFKGMRVLLRALLLGGLILAGLYGYEWSKSDQGQALIAEYFPFFAAQNKVKDAAIGTPQTENNGEVPVQLRFE